MDPHLSALYQSMMNVMCGYANRMHVGPPLTEHEFCVYQQFCRTTETFAKMMRQVTLEPYVKPDDGECDDV